jgi:hypothetical protein
MRVRGYSLDTFGYCVDCNEDVLRSRLRTDHADHYWTLSSPLPYYEYRKAMDAIEEETTQQELPTDTN